MPVLCNIIVNINLLINKFQRNYKCRKNGNALVFSSHLGIRLTETPMRMLDIRLLTLVSLTWQESLQYNDKISASHLDNDVVDMTLLHVFVDIRQGSDVEGRVGQHGVHPGEAEDGEGNVETTHH